MRCHLVLSHVQVGAVKHTETEKLYRNVDLPCGSFCPPLGAQRVELTFYLLGDHLKPLGHRGAMEVGANFLSFKGEGLE